jgi:hypothetical protein
MHSSGAARKDKRPLQPRAPTNLTYTAGMNPLPAWARLIPFLSVVAWLGASLGYRRMRGKPLFYARLPGTKYRQTNASGRSHRSRITSLGGASRVLVVQVTADELDIHLQPPFNWFFMPEIYGLEYRVPLSSVRSAELRKGLFRTAVDVVMTTQERGDEKVTLYLAHPEDFLNALGEQVTGTPQTRASGG